MALFQVFPFLAFTFLFFLFFARGKMGSITFFFLFCDWRFTLLRGLEICSRELYFCRQGFPARGCKVEDWWWEREPCLSAVLVHINKTRKLIWWSFENLHICWFNVTDCIHSCTHVCRWIAGKTLLWVGHTLPYPETSTYLLLYTENTISCGTARDSLGYCERSQAPTLYVALAHGNFHNMEKGRGDQLEVQDEGEKERKRTCQLRRSRG